MPTRRLPESPDSPFHPRLDLSTAGSRQQPTAAAKGTMGHADCSSSADTAAWTAFNASWETSWFGCGLCEPPSPETEVLPCQLATYGSLYGPLKSPLYLSASVAGPDAAYSQQLTAPEFSREEQWGSPAGPADLRSLPAALGSSVASSSRPHLASHDFHTHQHRITPSTVSPEGGSSSTNGVLHGDGSGATHDVPVALQLSSDDNHGSGMSKNSLIAKGSYDQIVLPPPATEDDTADDSRGGVQLPARPLPLQPAMLGTWVTRQYHLLDGMPGQALPQSRSQPDSIAEVANHGSLGQMRSVQSQEQLHAGDGSGETAAAAQHIQHGQQHAHQQQQYQQQQQHQEQQGARAQDAAMEAAWRWRFARRWHAEQQRCQVAEAGSPDKTDEALAYLHAGGGAGWNMQVAIARTQSTEASGLHSMGTQGPGSLLAGEMLLEDGSYQASGSLQRSTRNHVTPPGDSATRHVNSLNRRAMHLLEQQQQLERAAEERWNTSCMANGGDMWVGHHLNTVEIDDWGTFKFLVLRVRGRNDRQRILIRGRNYCSEGQITEDINRKMVQLAAQKGCSTESLEVMGGGVMEWRRERDRHLHLHSGFSCTAPLGPAACAAKPTSCQELLNLAAVLTKQHLPVNFKVSIQGQVL